MMDKSNLLEVNDLFLRFHYNEGVVKALNGVDFNIKKGEAVGLVGESGCGKSVTSLSILRLLPEEGEIPQGNITYEKESEEIIDLTSLKPNGNDMRKIRGQEISMIFQEPMTAFSPVHTIGNQIVESIIEHRDLNKKQARKKAVELLDRVGISNPGERIDEYPFQYSGGMRQRAMIAMALAADPRLLIADEPTTALDVTIQAQVLNLIKEMRRDFDLSLLLITHDLGVIAHMVEKVCVMYLGRIVEAGPVKEIFDNPLHPYTRDLLGSIPKLSGNKEKLVAIEGSVPDSYTLPAGCSFHPRCQDVAGQQCRKKIPEFIEKSDDHYVSCFLHSSAQKEVMVHD